jgi:hypothetical protein
LIWGSTSAIRAAAASINSNGEMSPARKATTAAQAVNRMSSSAMILPFTYLIVPNYSKANSVGGRSVLFHKK